MSKLSITGVAAAIIVIISAFFPWVTIESKNLVFTGLDTKGSSFGEPAVLNIAFSIACIVLFFFRKRPAILANLFCATFLTAWSFRNMLLFSRCEMGECPHREAGLFLSVGGAFLVLICVLFQKVKKA